MKLQVVYGLVLMLLAAGCKDTRGDAPVLSQAQMVPVIYELMLSEEYSRQHSVKDSTVPVDVFRNEKYAQIFRLRNVDTAAFITSYTYYLGHPDELKAIFDSVQATATRRRLELMHPSRSGRDKLVLPAKGKIKDSMKLK